MADYELKETPDNSLNLEPEQESVVQVNTQTGDFELSTSFDTEKNTANRRNIFIVVPASHSFKQEKEFFRVSHKTFRVFSISALAILVIILVYNLVRYIKSPLLGLGNYLFSWFPAIALLPLFLLFFLYSQGIFCSEKKFQKQMGTLSPDAKIRLGSEGFSLPEAKDQVILYSSLYQVIETPSMFYLYTDKYNAVLLDKNSFREGAVEELQAVTREKVDAKKYKKANLREEKK